MYKEKVKHKICRDGAMLAGPQVWELRLGFNVGDNWI